MRQSERSAWHYIKRYKLNSLLIKNFLCVISCVTLPMMLLVYICFDRFNESMNFRMMEANEEILQKSEIVTDNILNSVADILEQLSSQEEIVNVIQASVLNSQYNENVEKLSAQIQKYTQMNEYIKGTYIYSEVNGQMIERHKSNVSESFKGKGKWYYIFKKVPMESMYILVDDKEGLLFCQPIFDETKRSVGVVVFSVDLWKIRDILEKDGNVQNGIFYIVAIDGSIIYSNQLDFFQLTESERNRDKDDINRVKSGETLLINGGTSRFISVVDSAYKGWKYALIVERPMYEKEVGILRSFLLTSVIAGVIISALISYFITVITYLPVKKILDVIEEPRKYLDEKHETKNSNELLYIIANILSNVSSKHQMHVELEERLIALKWAQSQALQFQIDPHFLYNTLETIKWSAIEDMGAGNRTSKMITKVARLYRIGLEADNTILTLERELEYLKLYTEILQMRFGEKVHVVWNIDKELLGCKVIKLCIQPLVENAINHGLRLKQYKGTIIVSAFREQNKLYISVEDDGVGISEEHMEELEEMINLQYGASKHAVGLRNVNVRIKLLYGDDYGVTLSRRSQGEPGTKVMLVFPYV